ncbi:MAG: transporter substrate-binding domain-containing protein [Deltaproteobacteria bacterium]|nr:transporter substrate-binding domain-containing protein [Deltaproteobacteria bacterium]
MKLNKRSLGRLTFWVPSLTALLIIALESASGADLQEVRKTGVLRHLGVPYANFVTGSGDGLDVELVTLFARHLGVGYKYIRTSWKDVIADLTGKRVQPRGSEIEILGHWPVKGDIIASGMTILSWRKKIVAYSVPTFPTQIWLITQADSPIKPIKPCGDLNKDIAAVKTLLKGHSVLGVANTCLDPSLYGLKEAGAEVRLFTGKLNELTPAIINRDADATLLDVPDALVALEKWAGKIKVIGPVSHMQNMGYAFAKTSLRLRDSFNRFFEQCKKDGTYVRLVKKYYLSVFSYYPEFFE